MYKKYQLKKKETDPNNVEANLRVGGWKIMKYTKIRRNKKKSHYNNIDLKDGSRGWELIE